MKKAFISLKKQMIEIYKTLYPFKWYLFVYWIFSGVFFLMYLNPPAPNDPIFKAEETRHIWYYTNQEIYIEAARLYSVIVTLIFLVVLSNIKHHSKLAKFVCLIPLLYFGLNFLSSLLSDIL